MERVAITSLMVGGSLDSPLFDRTGMLLLEGGQALTPSMLESLGRSGATHVYLGAWDPTQVARLESEAANYKAQAGKLMDRLDASLQEAVSGTADASREYQPGLARGMDLRPRLQRLAAQLKVWEQERQEATNTAGLILGGAMCDAEIPGAAGSVVQVLLNQFKADPYLVIQLMLSREQDAGTYEQACCTAQLAMSIAVALGQSEAQVTELGVAALLKDIGMQGVDPHLLDSKRKLTPAEMVDVQKHTIIGLDMVSQIQGLPQVTRHVVYQHHERVDGKGYPKGRTKDEIHLSARIVAVADAYNSLVEARNWRPAYHPYRAMETILRQSDKAYDSSVVRGLFFFLSLFPVGCLMKLATGEVVRVIAANGRNYDRPVVFVLQPSGTGSLKEHQIVDLMAQPDIKVAAPHELANLVAFRGDKCPSLMAV